MAASTATPVLVGEYLESVYRPDCEFLDGELLERNVGEWDHSRLQGLLYGYLLNREKQWGTIVAIEQRVQVKSNRFRVPDILVIVGTPPVGQIISEPPFLCIEVLSPSDRMSEMQDRIQDYLTFGVAYVWVVDPRSRRAYVYTNDSMHEVKDGVLRTGDSVVVVPLSELG